MAVDLKMEVYTPALELVGMLNTWKSIMWEEKAFTAGSFSLDSLITSETRELLVKENIIWIEGYTAGTIEHIEKKSDKTGPYVTVKGRLLTGILGRRILWGLYNLTGKPADIMHRLVDDCCVHPTRGNAEARVIPNLVLLSPDTGGTSISTQKTGGSLLEALELYGETYNVAFGVRFNAAVPQMEFWTRYGVNRSVHQAENEPVFYSTELDDVLSSEYSYDSSIWRNVGLVAGEGEGSDRVYVTVEDYDESQGGNGGGDVTPPPVEIPTYTITATVDPAGSGTVTGAGQYKDGESVSLAATANDGYNFDAWKEGDATVHSDADYTFPAENSRDLVAAFKKITSSRLPEGYTEIEYIEATGTQYIDLNVSVSARTKFEIDIHAVYVAGINNYILGVFDRTGASTSTYRFTTLALSCISSNQITAQIAYNQQSSGKYDAVASLNFESDRFLIDVDLMGKSVSADGDSRSFPAPSSFNTTCTPYLFGYHRRLAGTDQSVTTFGNGKVYSCNIYDNNVLIRHFVPCTNPLSQVGMYDLIDGKFYGNAGTGTFIAGPAV